MLLLGCASAVSAAPRSNYPAVKWSTTETEHFIIHYHAGVEWTARKVTEVAEEAYTSVTKIYDYKPAKKTHIVVRDLEDNANGFAVWHLDWITIWATNSIFPLRGRHDWVYGTLVHEYAHIVSLQRSAMLGKLIEGVRIGGLADDDNDANTDFGGSIMLSSNPAPRWWAEAAAQLDTELSGHDLWDTNQDMLLRAATLEDNLLTFDEMHNIRVRENFGPELVYNQGFSFLRFLEKNYGGNVNRRLAESQRAHAHFDFEKNFREVFGKPARVLYAEWIDATKRHYTEQVAGIRAKPIEGERIHLLPEAELKKINDAKERAYADGVWNAFPRFSPDGHFFSYVNNNTTVVKYLYRPYDLSLIEGSGVGDFKTIEPTETNTPGAGVNASFSNINADTSGGSVGADPTNPNLGFNLELRGRTYAWAPQADQLLVSRKRPQLTGGYQYYDLYHVDLRSIADLGRDYVKALANRSDKDRVAIKRDYQRRLDRLQPRVTRLSTGLRAVQPAWSADGSRIAFIKNADGGTAIYIADLRPGGEKPSLQNIQRLAYHGDGAQCFELSWSADGKRLAYSMLPDRAEKGGIWIYDFDKQRSTPLLANAGNIDAEYRDPYFSRDGAALYLSSDRSGIFQIYKYDLATHSLQQLTNVSGGAFQPHARADGQQLLFTNFTSFGFKLNRLNAPTALPTAPLAPVTTEALAVAPHKYPTLSAKPYRLQLRPPRLFPSLVLEDTQIKAGLSLQVSDYLEKHHLFGAILLGRDQDYTVSYLNRSLPVDLFATYSKFVRGGSDTIFINDNDGFNDEPRTKLGFDIDFVSAGIAQHFYPREVFTGDHEISLSYNSRFVERQLGIPVQLIASDPTSIATSFTLITNHNITLEWNYTYFRDEFDPRLDVNPRDGRYIRLAYSHVWSELFAPDTSFAVPDDSYQFEKFSLNYTEYLPVPKIPDHTLELRFLGGYIDRDVSVNDEFFAGGRLNFRAFGDISSNSTFYGFEDFSIRGETLLLLTATWRFPIATNIGKKSGVIYYDSIYGGLFTEVGNAWQHDETQNCQQKPAGSAPGCGNGNTLLEDVGAEVRLKAFLFNDFNPWNSIARVAYGFQDSADYGFSDDDLPVRFYVGIGTDF